MAYRERRDIVQTTDETLSEALMSQRHDLGVVLSSNTAVSRREDGDRLAIRATLIESPESDPTGHERVIGQSDLTSINYLDRGRRAAAAVCRIRAPSDGGEWYGTGFLVGPRLVMTNHHVLGSANEASQAEAEFGYEHDVDGVIHPPIQFNLRPHEIFFTDPDLDVTFIAISPLSDGGVPIERYRWLQLLPPSGKAVDKEWVTIIQHPNGGPKQIAIRSSRIVNLEGVIPETLRQHFVHYLTDTEPGSSGAPVLNDQWQVVALHHKAVPAPPPTPKNPDGTQKFIGNEGVRISSIYQALEELRFTNPNARRVLDRLEKGLGRTPIPYVAGSAVEDAFEKDAKPFAITRWKKDAPNIGYDPSFLSEKIELEPIYSQAKADGSVAPLLNGGGHELSYNRFSVVVHAKRKFALLTAVNIHGKMLKNPGDRPSVWRVDDRMDSKYQPAGNFYEAKLGDDEIQFSRGHLVRRLDPSWGRSLKEAQLGDQDTFHYSNAAPQFQTYNNVDWGDLEDYVLDRAQTEEKKLTVFQGPIFRARDPWYGKKREGGPWRIPLSFWKIAVLEKRPGTIVAAAFIIGQTQYVDALYEAKVFTKLSPYSVDELREQNIQTTIAAIEKETKLNFEAIRRFDAQGGLESTRRTRPLTGPEDIII